MLTAYILFEPLKTLNSFFSVLRKVDIERYSIQATIYLRGLEKAIGGFLYTVISNNGKHIIQGVRLSSDSLF